VPPIEQKGIFPRGNGHSLLRMVRDTSKLHGEWFQPEPDWFVADVDLALVQDVLDVAKRKWKPDVEHHR
jgi:hypothetical protein